MRKLKCLYIVLTLMTLLILNLIVNKNEVANETHGWNLILVNEDHYIPEDYEVELANLENGEKVDTRIYPALKEMLAAAMEDDVYLRVAAGYRTWEEQQSLMDEKVEDYQKKVLIKFVAEKLAEQWVAIPGTSEHQLGLAVDINADAIHSSSSEAYTWLAKHAHEYGFIQRYPEDKSDITGISYEPWHYRYVGEAVAKEMFEAEICLEEYIEKLD